MQPVDHNNKSNETEEKSNREKIVKEYIEHLSAMEDEKDLIGVSFKTEIIFHIVILIVVVLALVCAIAVLMGFRG